jgi:hypothetical protein
MLRIWKRSARQAFPYRILGPPVPIVADAAIATDVVGDGRFIPLVILDTVDRPDIAEIIELQEKVPPGVGVGRHHWRTEGSPCAVPLFFAANGNRRGNQF